MKLRTQLILAFLVLSVVPLVGATLYSYNSSIQAFRQAVEAEADRHTEEMGTRLELITSDLSERVGQLEGLPYGVLPARHAQAPGVVDAGPLYAALRSSLGDSASLLRTIEVTPEPEAPEPPAGVGTPAPPPPAPFVIHLGGLRLDKRAAGRAGTDARLVRAGNDALLVPGQFGPGEGPPDEEQLAQLIESLHGADDDQVADAIEDMIGVMTANVPGVVEHIQREIATSDAQRAQVAAALDEARKELAQAREAARSAKRIPEFKLERNLRWSVRRDGERVATMEARIDTQEVLRTVLSRTQTGAGEIAFAVGADGAVFTPDAEDQRTLDTLGAAALGQAAGPGGSARIHENWIVVTRQVPGLDFSFGIARPVGESLEQIRRTAGRNMGWGLGLVGVAMLGIVPLSGRMTRHLSALSQGAARLAAGDLEVQVPVRSRDEIGELARAFNRMGQSLRDNQRELVQQVRLRKELEMCRQIQRELLPSAQLRLRAAEIRAVSLPASEVGGDFFNYFALPDGEIAVLMGDVSGKGVPAAMMMANLQATLRARIPLEGDLAQLARCLDVELEESTPHETYVTLFMGVIDSARRTLRYVNAGHNAQFALHRDGGVERMASTGRPLGLLSGGEFVERHARLEPGDMLFLFTDGLVEVEDAAGETFGERRLEALLVAERASDPDRFLERIERTVSAHRGSGAVADDATMLVLRIEAPAPER